MSLPILKKRTETKYIELNNKESSNLSFIREDVPKIVFRNSELETKIGQWLEVLASKEQQYVAEGVVALVPISARTLMAECLYKDQKNAIAYTFGYLLKQLGISETETCILDDYDEKAFSCSCYFEGEKEKAKFSFRWGDIMDYLPELDVDYHNAKRSYEYYAARDGKKPVLSLSNFTVVNPKNSNVVYSYLSPFDANYQVTNGDMCLSIKVKKPKHTSIYPSNGYVFRLKNDSDLVKYLLELSFPIELDQVYKKMSEISLNFDIDYSNVHLVLKKGVEDKDKKITDEIYIKDGQMQTFTLTKNGKKVSIDNEGNALYQDKVVTVNQHKDGSFEYHLVVASREKLSMIGTIEENLDKAMKDVSNIRCLAKTFLGKDI